MKPEQTITRALYGAACDTAQWSRSRMEDMPDMTSESGRYLWDRRPGVLCAAGMLYGAEEWRRGRNSLRPESKEAPIRRIGLPGFSAASGYFYPSSIGGPEKSGRFPSNSNRKC